jgi:2-methylisocitrate lyase-like PEP mutase family enzyme
MYKESRTMADRFPSKLRYLLSKPGVTLAPGVVDALSAKLARDVGFQAVFMGGNATTAVRLGTPDVGLLTLTEMADSAARIVDAAGLPLVVDADTGYGNALNVQRTIREFERAGVAGFHMEDQASPKKCGHFQGKILIPTREMEGKIKAAVDARQDPDFLIIARTDAIAVDGLDAALERAEFYYAAGADMLMFGPPMEAGDFEKAKILGAPLLAILDSSGRTPVASPEELEAMGIKLGIFPTAVVMSLIPAIRQTLETLYRDGSLAAVKDNLASFDEYHEVLGLPEIQALEQRYAEGSE